MTYAILGLVNAGTYALIAIGMVAVYQGSRVFNLAHGPIVVLAAYLAILATTDLGQGLLVAFVISVVAGLVATFILYGIVFVRLRAHHLSAMIASFVAGSGLVALMLHLVNSGEGISMREGVRPKWTVTIAGAVLSSGSVLSLLIAFGALAALAIVASRTSLGQALRAVADTERGATLAGISPNVMHRYAFLIAGLSAGIAGFVIAIQFAAVGADSALNLMVKALAAALLGGMSRYSGAMLGAIAIGLVESISIGTLSGGIAPIITNALIIGLLIWRPRGLVRS